MFRPVLDDSRVGVTSPHRGVGNTYYYYGDDYYVGFPNSTVDENYKLKVRDILVHNQWILAVAIVHCSAVQCHFKSRQCHLHLCISKNRRCTAWSVKKYLSPFKKDVFAQRIIISLQKNRKLFFENFRFISMIILPL